MNILLLIIPLAPIAALLLLFGLKNRLTPKTAGIMYVAGTFISLIATLILTNSKISIETLWLKTGALSLTVGLSLDHLSYLMAILVTSIGLLVGIYSIGYMEEETDQVRFYSILSFFIAAMLTLVLSNTFILLFIAWESVSIASFLLIGFRFWENTAGKSALTALLTTKVGDVGLFLGVLLAISISGTNNISLFLHGIGSLPTGILTVLALLFFLGAMGKSAQLPLSLWLPGAMVAPTPVSALLHSATMVASGVYLLVRFAPLFARAPLAMTIILIVSAITALLASLIATSQMNLKRILAWSTIAQLAEMMIGFAVGSPLAAIFLLTTQAIFKSTLFLTAGAIDRASGSLFIDKLGGLAKKLPVVAFAFTASALALSGIPPFSGFWSEEKILSQAVFTSPWLGVLYIILIFLAGVYIARAGTAVFLSRKNFAPVEDIKKISLWIQIPLVVLGISSIIAGWLLSGMIGKFIGLNQVVDIPRIWSIMAVSGGIGGLVLGFLKVKQSGPVPGLSRVTNLIEPFLAKIIQFPVLAAFLLNSLIQRFEIFLDYLASSVSRAAFGAALGNNQVENFLDNATHSASVAAFSTAYELGNNGMESLLDNATRSASVAAFSAAYGHDKIETWFDKATYGFAESIEWAGERARSIQSGKLYLYILSILLGTVFLIFIILFFYK
jgi:NADH-quinone oxidoreductase subunit L